MNSTPEQITAGNVLRQAATLEAATRAAGGIHITAWRLNHETLHQMRVQCFHNDVLYPKYAAAGDAYISQSMGQEIAERKLMGIPIDTGYDIPAGELQAVVVTNG